MGKAEKPWCRTEGGCGSPGTSSWDYCDENAVERRYHKGALLSVAEFEEHYGREAVNLFTKAEQFKEYRKAEDDNWYDIHRFRDYYINEWGEVGWVQKWVAAEIRRWNDNEA